LLSRLKSSSDVLTRFSLDCLSLLDGDEGWHRIGAGAGNLLGLSYSLLSCVATE